MSHYRFKLDSFFPYVLLSRSTDSFAWLRIHAGTAGLYFDGHTIRPIICEDRLGSYLYVKEERVDYFKYKDFEKNKKEIAFRYNFNNI